MDEGRTGDGDIEKAASIRHLRFYRSRGDAPRPCRVFRDRHRLAIEAMALAHSFGKR